MQKVLPFIIQVLAMGLNEKDSISYLEDQGFKISARYLYKLKKKVKENRFHRLSLIAQSEFKDQHIQRIEKLETIELEYWKLYRKEKKPINQAQILQKIVEVQNYISSYYDASRYVMEKSIQEKSQQDTNNKKKRRKLIDVEQQESTESIST